MDDITTEINKKMTELANNCMNEIIGADVITALYIIRTYFSAVFDLGVISAEHETYKKGEH